MTTRAGQRSFPSPPKRSLPVKDPLKFQALTPEMMISETDDDVMGDKVAQEILRDNRLQQDRRKQKETKDRLGSIQDRISRALSRYDLGMSTIGDGGNGEDFQLDRKKSEQAFDVFIFGFNESAEKKSKLLESLYNFFLIYEEDENTAASPTPTFDIESSYETAVDALQTANASLERLASIHGALIDGYSTKLKDKENKRKTKKLEMSFKEAQNELVALKDTLETTTRSLNDANTKAEGLRKTLDMKTSELEKNKLVIEKLRKQTENLLGVDERKLLKERTEMLNILEKENTELKLHVGQLEFSVRRTNSKSVQDNQESSAAEELIADLQNKMSEERDKAAERTAETLRIARAGLEAEFEETLERKNEEFEMQLGDLKNKLAVQESTIEDLENQLSEVTRSYEKLLMKRSKMFLPIVEPTPTPTPTPEPTPEVIETVVPAPISERTTSAVSVDPTEALNKKYKELEEEYEKKRAVVEEEIARNDQKYPQNQSKIEELKGELLQAKDEWLQEKTNLEDKVESFRKMVAEMEAEALEQAHKLDEMLKERDRELEKEQLEISSIIGSQDSEEEDDGAIGEVHVKVPGRPTTAVRNTLTPGPDNPVVTQVVTMYDHVTDFKEKLVEILCEIQGMGVIDETETMLMMRSLEQINTVEFVKEGDIHDQIEGIQNSIAQVMHSSEKTVHKIFKKLSKERSKIEKLTWSPVARSPPKSRQRSVAQCDRATSPIQHFKPLQAPKSEPIRGNMRRAPAQYTAMFAFTDLEHNRRSLKQAVLNHKITPKQYEEVVAMMKDYTNIPQKRLQHLAKHYISHARMQIMEENIQMNRPVNEDIDDVLSRLDELYLLRKTRYGAEMDELAIEREDLAYLLTKQLDRLEHQSGIFLIKPYIAYKAHTLNKNQQKKTPVFVQQTRPTDPSTVQILEQPQEPETGSTWSVGASRTTPVHDWTPDIPKLLEMDCNRITVARNTVSQPADSRNSSKTIKSFVVVRPSKSTGSFRPKSNATSTAEFLSINSDYKSEEVSLTTSDNLPPLRSGYTSGFVSTSNSRQRLAPIVSPPSSINVEKATSVT